MTLEKFLREHELRLEHLIMLRALKKDEPITHSVFMKKTWRITYEQYASGMADFERRDLAHRVTIVKKSRQTDGICMTEKGANLVELAAGIKIPRSGN